MHIILNAIAPFTASQVFLIFIIYSFIGWASEVLYVGIFSEHKFVNRGFLHGPICPIYGVGGLVILLLPSSLKLTWIPLFFAVAILCTLIEYFSSWILEKLFNTKWWDYSNHKFNINGRVCLLNSTLFGLLGIVIVHFVQPFIEKLIFAVSPQIAEDIAFFIFIAFITDLLITVHRLVDFSNVMAKRQEFNEAIKERFADEPWFKNSSFSERLASLKEKAKNDKEKFTTNFVARLEEISLHHKNTEHFLRLFPTMQSKTYAEALAFSKERVKAKIK